MQLIEKFHKMEIENSLFELEEGIDLYLWDIIRYNVFIKYYYSEVDRKRLETTQKHSIIDFFVLVKMVFLFFLKLPFAKANNFVCTCSRYVNREGKYFDKSALPIINHLKGDCTIIEPILKKDVAYSYLYDFSNVLRRLRKKNILSIANFNKIEKALKEHLGECRITYSEINRLLLNFESDFAFFKYLFWIKGTKKIFIATGNPKAQLKAAQVLDIQTYLLQHASIEIDEIDYSYPQNITRNSRVLFPDFVLTFGDYWCKGFNVPAKEIIPIGNDFFFDKPTVEVDNSILVISTIVHGEELKNLTKSIANNRKDLKFIYKLHPNEFQYLDSYLLFFENEQNVSVIKNEIDTNLLIAKSALVILIVSAVLYEALNQNKKIAIYKRINYERQLHLLNLKNVYLFDNELELADVFDREIEESDVDFYKSTDYDLISKLFSENK